jgi:hypothetical protein
MRKGWLILILSVGVVAIVAGVLIARHHIPWLSSPTYGLVVAVGPQTEHGKRFLAAFNRQAAEEYPHVYFKVASFENLDAAGKALTDRSADLAVLRSDQPAAGSSGTLLILRKLVAAILVAPNASVENARDLKGRLSAFRSSSRMIRSSRRLPAFTASSSSSRCGSMNWARRCATNGLRRSLRWDRSTRAPCEIPSAPSAKS